MSYLNNPSAQSCFFGKPFSHFASRFGAKSKIFFERLPLLSRQHCVLSFRTLRDKKEIQKKGETTH